MSRNSRHILVALVTCTLAVAAFANPTHYQTFQDTYKPKAQTALAKAACLTCHAVKMPTDASHPLNSYGKDVLAALKSDQPKAAKPVLTAAILHQIEPLDSDRDGAKNGAEIKAGTLPGDAHSKP